MQHLITKIPNGFGGESSGEGRGTGVERAAAEGWGGGLKLEVERMRCKRCMAWGSSVGSRERGVELSKWVMTAELARSIGPLARFEHGTTQPGVP